MIRRIGQMALGCLLAMQIGGCAYFANLGDDRLPTARAPMPEAEETVAPDPMAMTDSQPALRMEKVAPPTAVVKAVEHPDRSADDVALDAARKPLDVMAFAGIEAGQTILEMEAGGGYFTELLSRAVGPTGRIYMHNPPAFDAFLGDSVNQRLAGRLSNVIIMKTRFDRLPLAEGSVDIVTWFQGPHELWYTPDGGASLGDPEATFAAIARVLKPGGRLVVLDHRAPAGAPASTGGDTHRIDPAIIVDLARAAGFTIAGESDMLRSEVDDLTLSVFDERVRRQTDQFLISFTSG